MMIFEFFAKLVVLLHLIITTQQKHYAKNLQTITLRLEKSWVYLDKMSFKPPSAQINLMGYFASERQIQNHNYQISLLMIPDYLWEYEQQYKCQSSQSLSNLSTKNDENKQNKSVITLNLSHDPEQVHKQTVVMPIYRQITYYFVLVDCKKFLINEYFNKKTVISIQLDITNNGRNYGTNEFTYLWIIPLIMAFCFLLLYFSDNMNEKVEQEQDINWPAINLKIIIWCHILGLFVYYIGLLIYVAGTGIFYSFFSFIFLIFSTVSETITLILIIFLACGWMSRFNTIKDQQIYFPIGNIIDYLASIAGFACIVFALLSKINDGDANKTHIYDSVPYDLLIIIKVIGILAFVIGIVNSFTKIQKNNKQLIKYFKILAIFGIFCFLVIPIFLYTSQWIQKHTRWSTVFISVQIIRTIQIVIIWWQLTYKKSIYNKVTLYNRSFMEHDNKYL